MAVSFANMLPRDITAIKMKMPITRNLEHHQKSLHGFNNTIHTQASSFNIEKSEEKLSIADVRAIFKNP
ncbi:MAG: hypothetical protein M1486_06000 [Gammaproteobacteria bacterium]|nr:hypothetical protein [Gammaproteobacteria bacterium]